MLDIIVFLIIIIINIYIALFLSNSSVVWTVNTDKIVNSKYLDTVMCKILKTCFFVTTYIVISLACSSYQSQIKVIHIAKGLNIYSADMFSWRHVAQGLSLFNKRNASSMFFHWSCLLAPFLPPSLILLHRPLNLWMYQQHISYIYDVCNPFEAGNFDDESFCLSSTFYYH